VELASGKHEETELYDAIPRRHTNRSAYSPQKPIPSQFVDTLSRLASNEPHVKVFLFTADAEVGTITAWLHLRADTEPHRRRDVLSHSAQYCSSK